ncbi:hypothetical protein LIP_1228 [Limnochorda pilosa]|uniref:Uncharacterized protein n=1 Tax=Limnochorda pilosa TaxID=1555112 RepID=A0A0K2SJ19_LIMPI|nr:hypothetical protein LIP_1228 [Limnochorda pilosa]
MGSTSSLANVEADASPTAVSGSVAVIHARVFGAELSVLPLEAGGGFFSAASGSVHSDGTTSSDGFAGAGLGGYLAVMKVEARLGGTKLMGCMVCGGGSVGLGAGKRFGVAWGLWGFEISSGP